MEAVTVEFRRLSEMSSRNVTALQSHPRVRWTLPLAQSHMDEAGARRFIAAKERLWEQHGYGPWAFFVGGTFAAWGGLQPEGPDADLGLVLHPNIPTSGGSGDRWFRQSSATLSRSGACPR